MAENKALQRKLKCKLYSKYFVKIILKNVLTYNIFDGILVQVGRQITCLKTLNICYSVYVLV